MNTVMRHVMNKSCESRAPVNRINFFFVQQKSSTATFRKSFSVICNYFFFIELLLLVHYYLHGISLQKRKPACLQPEIEFRGV